jgi:hypothetical protein
MGEAFLRESQIQQLESEKTRLEGLLSDPKSQVQERGAMQHQVRNLGNQIDTQSPPQIVGADLDSLVREERTLREKMLEGMPSQAEMRQSPPGAIGKHLAWDRMVKEPTNERGETRFQRWKNIRMTLNRGSDDPDVANFERYRPRVSTLNLDNALIPGAVHSVPSPEFTKNYDLIEWEKGFKTETDEMRSELEQEILDLRNRIAERDELSQKLKDLEDKPARKPKPTPVKKLSGLAICGREFKGTTQKRLDFAIRQHKKWCDPCRMIDKKQAAGGDA